MKYGVLTRTRTNDEGTVGSLVIYEDEQKTRKLLGCVTQEPPWRWNAPEVSCVPAGRLLFKERFDSPKHGHVYQEWDDPSTPQREDVPGRPYIQIHALNLAGDTRLGFVRQSDGCLGLGRSVALFKAGTQPAGAKDQHGVTESGPTLAEFMAVMAGDLLQLNIQWAPGVMPPMSA
ncbi:MAG: DUF5675 family protein [Elusimicrobia bacterium]|nr:DUF5675 family protein [Elusimicrobiota bacterium]